MSQLEVHEAHHPTERDYVKVAITLAVITAAEVAVVYMSSLHRYIRPILGIMMVVKFVMVGGYFMHLKFDSPLFRRVFIMGIILALAVFGIVLAIFSATVRDVGVAG